MEPDQLDRVLSALAHATRRRMLDLVQGTPGISVKALSSHFRMSRIAVLKHLRVLADAQLVLSNKEGRVRHLFFNPVPIQLIYDRWTTDYSAFWAERMVDIKSRVETRGSRKESKSA